MKKGLQHLSRRERQIMDVIYKEGSATVADVLNKLVDPPGVDAAAHRRAAEDPGAPLRRPQVLPPRAPLLPRPDHRRVHRGVLLAPHRPHLRRPQLQLLRVLAACSPRPQSCDWQGASSR